MKQPWFLSSLRGRLILAFVGVIAVAMVSLAAVLPGLARAHQMVALEDRLADQAQLVADYVVTERDQGRGADLDMLAKRLGQRTQTRITIVALDGTVLGESHQDLSQVGNHAGRLEVQQALALGKGIDLHHSDTVGYDMLYVAVPILRDGVAVGIARAALPLSEVDRLVAELTRAILFTAIVGGLFAVSAAVLAAGAITRPLAQLTKMAAALTADPLNGGRLSRSKGPAEVMALGETLDGMASAVRESLRQLGSERDSLDAILANLADGVIVIDQNGRVSVLNAAAERLLSTRRVAATGRTLAEVLRDHELIQFVDQERAANDQSLVAMRLLEWRKPRRVIRAAVSRFGSDEASRTLLVLQDLSELHRLETVRRDFVANVSHDLRTPISAIKAMTETLRDGALDDREAALDFVARIEQEVDGMHRLVEELLELSKLESGRVDVVLVPTDAAQLLERAVRRLTSMSERARVSLTIEAALDLPKVMADAERMEQVLVNLIHNAIKFTPPGGAIVVRATIDGDYVRLSVADTGVGIAPELLPRIFERFYKADQSRAGGGTGLGLAIAKHTVQLHSGKIWAESAGPGWGTTVHVALPKAAGD